MIEESLAVPVCVAYATDRQDFTDSAEPCGAVEYWDTVLTWISFETPATRWLASLQVPDPDSEGAVESISLVESVDSIQWTEKGDHDESRSPGETL